MRDANGNRMAPKPVQKGARAWFATIFWAVLIAAVLSPLIVALWRWALGI